MSRIIPILAVAFAAGCGSPLHLQYDFGRAYVATLNVQADLTRPSVAHANYFLYGVEAAQIRINAQEATADAEDDESTVEVGGQ